MQIDDVMVSRYSGSWDKVTAKEKRYALIAFAETGLHKCAQEAVRGRPWTIGNWRNQDADFAAAWEEVRLTRLGHFEDITSERATGGPADSWSGRATEIMLERLDPEHYGKNRIEHSGGKTPAQIMFVDNSKKPEPT